MWVWLVLLKCNGTKSMMNLLLSHILSEESTRFLCWRESLEGDGMVLCFNPFCSPQSAYGQPSGDPHGLLHRELCNVECCKLSSFGFLANNLPDTGDVSWWQKECGIFSNNYHPSSSRQLWISSLFQHYSVKWKPQKQFCCWRQVCSLVKQGLQLQSNLFHKQSSGTSSFKEHPSYQQSNTVSYMLMLILTTQPENEIFRRHKEYWECKVQKFLMEGNSIHTLISSKNAFSKQRCFVLHHSCWLSGGFPLDVGTSCHSNQGQALLCLFYDTGYHESCIQTQEVFIYVEYILK